MLSNDSELLTTSFNSVQFIIQSMKVPESHPRYQSLLLRERVKQGVTDGYTSIAGAFAHGRGEAFDYLLGERTTTSAQKATEVAVAKLMLSEKPVLSCNGNVAALVPEEYAQLSKAMQIPVEINLFYRTPERMKLMSAQLERYGCAPLFSKEDAEIPKLESERRKIDSRGSLVADTILVPLEDGDRTEKLKQWGKYVITIDLNPLSRTARKADITIVDNICRVVPNMLKIHEEFKNKDRQELQDTLEEFNNKDNLRATLKGITEFLNEAEID